MTIALAWFCWTLWVLGSSLMYYHLEVHRVDRLKNPHNYHGKPVLTVPRMVVMSIFWWVLMLLELFDRVFLGKE